jgi:EgtB-related family protein
LQSLWPWGLAPCLALALSWSAPEAGAQSTPKDQSVLVVSEMKPYTETIPGTEISFELVPVPGGQFLMGSPESEENRSEDEGPQHPVEIAPFWMGKHEVTWDEFDQFAYSLDLKKKQREAVDLANQSPTEKAADAVTRPTPPYPDETHGFGREGRPAIGMSHHAAMEYCYWLSRKTGKSYGLPTEAEWEYAASIEPDAAEAKRRYPWGDEEPGPGHANLFGLSGGGPADVNAFSAGDSPSGLRQLIGNVWEWTADTFGPYPGFVADPYKEYSQPWFGDHKVLRGGSFATRAHLIRNTWRNFHTPERRDVYAGFRTCA